MRAATTDADRLLAFLEARSPRMLEFLESMAEMESPSSDKAALSRLLAWLEARFAELGFYTLLCPGRDSGGYLYARDPGQPKGAPVQLVLGHCDTVWPVGTLGEMRLRRHKDKLSGPGVYDMKAGITQLYFALSSMKELGEVLLVRPVILINSDEEVGSRESTPAIRRLARIAERALVLEPPLGLEGKLKTSRKGLGRYTFMVHGRAAHAGLDPEKGVNAIVAMSSLVQQLYALNDFDRGVSVNVGLIEGGISPNTVAPSSRLVVDVRVPLKADQDRLDSAIRALRPESESVQLEIEGGFGRPPMEVTPRNEALWQLAVQSGKQLGIRLEQAGAGGGSDANTTSQFTATLDGLGTPGDGAHAQHEFIFTDRLAERTALLALLLRAGPVKKKK